MKRSRSNERLPRAGAAEHRDPGRSRPRGRGPWPSILGVSLIVISSWVPASGRAAAAEKYGGVEIGAKGIKVAAVEVGSGPTGPTLKVLDLDKKTVDVTIARLKDKRFDAVRIDDVADVVADFVKALQANLGVPDENIQVVASSGVPFARNFADLTAAVRQRTGKDVGRIDAREEAVLTAMALVPAELRARALVVDVGSGNTKGGAFLDDAATTENFATFDVQFGTTTFSAAIDKKAAGTGAPRADVAREAGRELVGDPLRKQVEKPELARRDVVLFSGGSVWALVTIMKPEAALEPFPVVTAADIKAYADRLDANPGRYPEVDFAMVKDPAARTSAEADYLRVRGGPGTKGVFKPEELQAGAALLEQVSEAMEFGRRSVYFDRKGVTGWITARITPAEYRHLLPEAMGRRLRIPGTVEPDRPPKRPAAAPPRRIDDAAAERAYGAGYESYWSGRYPEALASLREAIALSSQGDARFSYYKGLAESALGDAGAAEASFKEGVRLQSRNLPDSQLIGEALVRLQGSPRQQFNETIRKARIDSGASRGR